MDNASNQDEVARLKRELDELKNQNRDLQEQLTQGETRSEKVLCLFTKSNVQRLNSMADYLGTSRNDILNRIVEHMYFKECYKREMCPNAHSFKGHGRGRSLNCNNPHHRCEEKE